MDAHRQACVVSNDHRSILSVTCIAVRPPIPYRRGEVRRVAACTTETRDHGRARQQAIWTCIHTCMHACRRPSSSATALLFAASSGWWLLLLMTTPRRVDVPFDLTD